MNRMPIVLSVLLCAGPLFACASSTPPTVTALVPTLPARPSGLLAVPARPLPPADDPPTQEQIGAYAFALLGHALALERQLRELARWYDAAEATLPQRAP